MPLTSLALGTAAALTRFGVGRRRKAPAPRSRFSMFSGSNPVSNCAGKNWRERDILIGRQVLDSERLCSPSN
jgi:hypothetical protein